MKGGVSPYPNGLDTATEYVEPGESHEEVTWGGLSKEQAITEGRALLKHMRGVGWRLRVWQNIGWHYQVSHGTLHVHVSHGDSRSPTGLSYWTLMGYPDGGGRPELSQRGNPHFNDPNEAVLNQVRFARQHIERLRAQVDQLMADVKMVETSAVAFKPVKRPAGHPRRGPYVRRRR